MATLQLKIEFLRLKVNTTKTRLRQVPQDSCRVHGYEFVEQVSCWTGRRYVPPAPAKIMIHGIFRWISELTGPNRTSLRPEVVMQKLNEVLGRWAN